MILISTAIALLSGPLPFVEGASIGGARIYGGARADISSYPFATQLDNKKMGSLCGGSLINEMWVLTAAHCVHETEPNQLKVLVGSAAYNPDKGKNPEKIIVHQDYNTDTHENDIALIKLSEGSGLSPVKIDTGDIQSDESVAAIGWGFYEADSSTPSSELQEVELKIISASDCRKIKSDFQLDGNTSQICTGNTLGKDTCAGDSGGPLLRTTDGVTRILGVTSYGVLSSQGDNAQFCNGQESIGIYTRVAKYLEFIKSSTGLATEDLT
ncbi:Transmembrane protease serine 11G [Zancudomyces culisetae]|uniref:Transmembrane protease serine 11G n=1 Tax=Zancudomyces culisetae TaxID=1213189 RepID=A0A1R1PMC5_ZANCU|nr:Transmembrane protease serine 11G [Zancudomyces culisetae]|eukprot:OMH82114.1 Transmembrane protease serine 11G [Zancudomyces culisetae]